MDILEITSVKKRALYTRGVLVLRRISDLNDIAMMCKVLRDKISDSRIPNYKWIPISTLIIKLMNSTGPGCSKAD